MDIQVKGHKVYAYTGGHAFDASKPSVVFIHGVLNDHSVWILQSRYLAHHGFNVLALDLPGHCKSDGAPPASAQAGGRWVLDTMDALGLTRAALVGHSLGSLIALEAAAQEPSRVTHLALLGTASPMKVSHALLDLAQNNPQRGIELVNALSHASLCPPPSCLGPGTWLYGSSRALMRRVHASNGVVNLFHQGFTLCNEYLAGNSAIASVFKGSVATIFISGNHDQMTPPKAAQALIDAHPDSQVVRLNSGHSLMSENPDGVLAALTPFLNAPH